MWLSRKYCNILDAITRSITLHATQIIRYRVIIPYLGRQTTFVHRQDCCIFQSSGNLPIDIKLENSIERVPASTLVSFLKKDGKIIGTT